MSGLRISGLRISRFRKNRIEECADKIVNDPDYAVEAGTGQICAKGWKQSA